MFDERKTQDLNQGRRGGTVVGLRISSTGELIDLEGGRRRWLLGSDNSCDIHVIDPYVSAMHCVLERRADGSLLVRDRESRNGTFIDGNVVEGAELRVGSYMVVGRTTLVAVAAAPGAERPKAIELLRGRDPVTRGAIELGLKAAQTECSVLIVGETGTGKDLMARLVHESSRRSRGPFVAVNCGAIPRELIGSELFGHEKGAFTGASDTRDGYFVEANGGTLFLDEIGELPLEMQPHLLRVLETKMVRRIGGQSERAVDVRIVAATNRIDGLGTESGHLRTDLYHRIATMVLSLPPLRERLTDIVELVQAVLAESEPEFGAKTIAPDGWQALSTYAWPGNVRELRHAVTRAVTLGGDVLGARDFFPNFQLRGLRLPTATEVDRTLVPYQAMLRASMEQALQTHGTIRAAALSLGMPKSTFADKARQWGLIGGRRPRRKRGV
jgi:transcriptional regulator with PAS, ATPase and Fis domain